MLTRKDFKAVAEIIETERDVWECKNSTARSALAQIARDLADYFATQNPRFDRQKFLNACGL